MRWFSADSLGKLQDPTAVNELVLLLQDQSNLSWEEKKVCEVAAEALENIGTPEACAAILNWRSKQAGTK
jgi:HEAT repeat protein